MADEPASTAQNQKSKTLPLSITSTCALIVASLGLIGEILEATTGLLKKWPEFQESLESIPPAIRYMLIGLILVLGVAGFIKARGTSSWIALPDRFNLDPGNPRHLKGRANDISNLRDACLNVCFIELTGESGSGKTALVRSGLIPRLNDEQSIHPLYLDSWGQDWEIGPLIALAASIQRTLNDADREKLGLTDPVRPEDAFTILECFRQRIGRIPIVFGTVFVTRLALVGRTFPAFCFGLA